jgi:hypothetical protein
VLPLISAFPSSYLLNHITPSLAAINRIPHHPLFIQNTLLKVFLHSHTTYIMKITQSIVSVLTLVSINAVLAAPVPVEDVALTVARTAKPEPEPVAAGYGSYGSYGSYAGAPIPTSAGTGSTPAGAYSSYGSYPAPAGGYGSYGAYKRVRDLISSLWT